MSSLTSRRVKMIAGVTMALIGIPTIMIGLGFADIIRMFRNRGHVAFVLTGIAFTLIGAVVFASGWWTSDAGKRSQFFIPPEGRAYLLIMTVLFCGSQIGSSNMLLMVFVAMAGPWMVNGWMTYVMLRRLSVQRLHPERVMSGDAFPIQYLVRNDKWWIPAWLLNVNDTLRGQGLEGSPAVLFLHVPANTQRAGDSRVLIRQRGRFALGPVHITTRFPLGMVQRGRRFAVRSEVLVYPRRGHLATHWKRQLLQSSELANVPRTRPGAFQDDLHQMREYRAGDDSRMIHWRTSARMNQLMVSEYHESRDRDVTFVIDCGLGTQPDAAADFERALSFVLTTCTEFLSHRRGSSLTVTLAGRSAFRWQGGLEHQPLDTLLDQLALVQGDPALAVVTVVDAISHELATGARLEIVSTRAEVLRAASEELPVSQQFGHLVRGATREDLQQIFQEG